MKKSLVLGLAFIAALSLVGCKSKESAYKKAYEKAKAQELATQQSYNDLTETTPVTTTVVTPVTEESEYDNTSVNANTNTSTDVTTFTNAVSNSNSNYNTSTSTASVKRYCVIVGSYENQSGAERVLQQVKNNGYSSAKIVYGDGRYRVAATSFSDMQSAKASRNTLIKQYEGAWILDTQK